MTPGEDTRALYDSMSTEELLGLSAALEADVANAERPQTVAFGESRLALIAEILERRGPSSAPQRAR
jgi:hypothetical protein